MRISPKQAGHFTPKAGRRFTHAGPMTATTARRCLLCEFFRSASTGSKSSLWMVDDQATAELMNRLYEKMLKQRMRPAAALGSAECDDPDAHVRDFSEPGRVARCRIARHRLAE